MSHEEDYSHHINYLYIYPQFTSITRDRETTSFTFTLLHNKQRDGQDSRKDATLERLITWMIVQLGKQCLHLKNNLHSKSKSLNLTCLPKPRLLSQLPHHHHQLQQLLLY
ncbi:hypothetical protein GDO81_011765 [Engystomops pustulosus]|uniref:Uncharacterized protein n=1 Tax=Engystomops pustulosus TaxID=76066 RepID=A0AAV7BGI5_ENGPU|nr:hypothetical protein GDO81_011765 [Engystomops pustulosus]